MSVTTEKVVVQVSVDGQVTLVSSVSSALGAASSAAVAQAAAAAALISETNADASEAAAAVSAAAALVSEGNADTSEANAAASAAAALISEGNADASAGAAATSASDALTSANNADVSEAAAAASAAAALVSQNAAAASAASAATATETLVEGGTLDASFASIKSSGDIVLAGTKKFYVDGVGGVGGDTYLVESSANVLDVYTGGVRALQANTNGIAITGVVDINPTAVLPNIGFRQANSYQAYFEGISGGGVQIQTGPGLLGASYKFNTDGPVFGGVGSVFARINGTDTVAGVRFQASAVDKVQFVIATGTTLLDFDGALQIRNGINGGGVGTFAPTSLAIPATNKLYLDGVTATGDTYLVESSANVLDLYAGGTKTLSLTASGAAVIGTLSATGIIQPSATESMRVLTGNEISFGHNTAGLGVGMYYNAGDDGINFYNRTGGLNSFRILRTGGISTFGVISGTLPDNTWGTRIITASGECQLSGWITAMGGPAIRAVNLGGGAYTPLNVDGSLVYLRASGNIVGTVSSTGLAVAATGKLYLDGGGDTYLVESSANVLDLYAGGIRSISASAGAITIGLDGSYSHTINGSVAQNTRNSVVAYSVTGATTGWSGYRVANTGGALFMGVATSTGTLFTGSTAYASGIGTEGALPLEFATNSTIRASIDATGNIGVGAATLAGIVNANSTRVTIGGANAATNGGEFVAGGAVASIALGSGVLAAYLWMSGAYPMLFGTSGVERMRLTATGSVALAATNKLYLDGVAATGDTYITESSADVLDTYVGGVNTLKSTPMLTTVTGTLSAPDLTVTVVDKTIFSATIVDTFLYDTSKDSDGGAWRKRCSHTSWENETLSGNWLGSAANEAAARAISGATTGSYYYDTTALGFYTLNAGSGKTATYRGNVRQFPAQVLITVEAARVVLWDLTQAGAPMWMVFIYNGSGYGMLGNIGSSSRVASSVAALNGMVCIGANGNAYANLYLVSFASDSASEKVTFGTYRFPAGIQSRNSGSLAYTLVSASNPIVNDVVNDVAMTILPNAPVDVATGLPVPTIAVATDGGVSVITHDGNVWDIVATSYSFAGRVMFRDDNKLAFTLDSVITSQRHLHVYAVPTADVSTGTAGYTKGAALEFYGNDPAWSPDLIVAPSYDGATAYRLAKGAVGAGTGLSLLRENPATPTKGMVAYITKDYNSGWQVGAIKGAWLADTVAETLTGTELVTNGTFATDTAGWTTGNSATFVQSGGAAVLTNGAASNGYAYQAITTVAGKTYVVRGDLTLGTATGPRLTAGTTTQGAELGVAQLSASGVFNLTFTATGTTTYITAFTNSVTSGHTATYDNISCRLADVDRSVKAKGLQAFGSLTKAAVASGAALMGYSGFSAANYLEQPYNSDLDFGTGDFCIMGWLKETPNGVAEVVCQRTYYTGAAYSGAAIQLVVNASGTLRADITDDGFSSQDTFASTAVVDDSVWRLVWLIRRGSYFELWFNGTKAATDAAVVNANTSLSNASATLRMGYMTGGTNPLMSGTLALWRISATAPSAEQIKHIYETEKALFEANAACTLAGSSNAVTALAYDEETDLLHVGTSYGRSAFKGLVRVSSEATPVGAITALAAGGGFIAQGGASGADIYIPAYTLREELSRRAEQAARLASALELITFTATASQTAFQLAVGLTPKYAYRNGLLLREGTTEDYAVGFDGFRWTVTLADASVSGDHITVMGVRSNG